MIDSHVLWFTGLSGSGKTTIANALCAYFSEAGKTFTVLDGDVIRETLHSHLSFSPEDITKNNSLVAELCVENMGKYEYILVPIISPFVESRREARTLIGDSFIEIYVKASLDEVVKRDVKGLYARAVEGKIPNFIGIDPAVPYEEPENPEIVLETDDNDLKYSVGKLIDYLESRFDNLKTGQCSGEV